MKANLLAVASLAVLAMGGVSAAGASIVVDVYSGHSTTAGGGAPYTGYVGTIYDDDVMFATENGYAWHPFGLSSFGADITGCLRVAADGDYTFSLDSDDGSMLYIDGILVIDNGGPHSPGSSSGVASLTAGSHSFEVQFYEDFGGESGVDLHLPAGVAYCTPDAGSSLALLGSGFFTIGILRRRVRG